jgi:hypothetical protein
VGAVYRDGIPFGEFVIGRSREQHPGSDLSDFQTNRATDDVTHQSVLHLDLHRPERSPVTAYSGSSPHRCGRARARVRYRLFEDPPRCFEGLGSVRYHRRIGTIIHLRDAAAFRFLDSRVRPNPTPSHSVKLTLVSVRFSTITLTRKLFTMLLSVIVYNHKLTAGQWIGAGIVFAGISIEAWVKRTGEETSPPDPPSATGKADCLPPRGPRETCCTGAGEGKDQGTVTGPRTLRWTALFSLYLSLFIHSHPIHNTSSTWTPDVCCDK